MFELLSNAASAVGSFFSSDEPAPAPTTTTTTAPPAPVTSTAIATGGDAPVHGRTSAEVAAAAPAPGAPAPAREPDPAAMRQAAADIFTAVDGMGTDEDAIHRALEGRSPAEIAAIRAAYADHYPGRTLDGDLEDELSGDELEAARAALTADPVAAAAATLVNAASGLGTDEEAIHRTLEHITDPAQRAAVAAEYQRRTGESLSDMLSDEMSDSDLDVANALADGDIAGANAARLDEAMNGTFLGIDFGTDEDAAYGAIENARTPEARAALVAAYEARTGRTLDADLRSEMEGPELDVATSLVTGDAAGAAAARMAVAADGLGTDESAIFAQMEGRSQEERDAMIAAYNARYGAAAGGRDFDAMLTDEMGEMDAERARQLRADGRLDPVFALNYAMDGVGTDESMIRDQLRGRSAEEIAQFRTAYRQRYGRDLDEDLGGENSGRDGFEISQMMLGEPRTPEERLARANAAYEFERGEGAGIFGAAVTDLFSDSGHYLDLQHQRMNEIGARMTAGTATPEDLERLETLADYHSQDVHSYQAARDTATNAAAMAGTAVVGTAVSILTAGAASPAVVAALAALAGGATGMAIRAGMQGDSYSNEDMAVDAVTTIASAATAGVLQGASAQALFRSIAGVAEGAVPTLAQQMTIQALQGAAGGAANGLVSGALNEQNYQGDIGDWLAGMATSTGMGALQGGVAGVATGAVQARFGEAPPGMDPRMWAAIAGGAGGAAGGAAQSLIDPATYEGRWEDIALRFGNNIVTNALQEAAEGANSAHLDMSAPRAAVADADGRPVVAAPDEAPAPVLHDTAPSHDTAPVPHDTAPVPHDTAPVPHDTAPVPHDTTPTDIAPVSHDPSPALEPHPILSVGDDRPAVEVHPILPIGDEPSPARPHGADTDAPPASERPRAGDVEDDPLIARAARPEVRYDPDLLDVDQITNDKLTSEMTTEWNNAADRMSETAAGREALEQLGDMPPRLLPYDDPELVQMGAGAFSDGFNVTMGIGGPSGTGERLEMNAVHEARHRALQNTEVGPDVARSMGRDEFVDAYLLHEGQSYAAEIRYATEAAAAARAGAEPDLVRADRFEEARTTVLGYDAYQRGAAEARAALADQGLSPAEVEARAHEAGARAIADFISRSEHEEGISETSYITTARDYWDRKNRGEL